MTRTLRSPVAAVQHTAGGGELRLTLQHNTILIEVADTDPQPPTLRTHDPRSLGGRGLIIVAAIARRWGHQPTPHGPATPAKSSGPNWCFTQPVEPSRRAIAIPVGRRMSSSAEIGTRISWPASPADDHCGGG